MYRILFNKEFWIVLVIFILALSLRLPTLASPLIEDEAISFNRYIDKPWGSLIYNYYDTNQHTLSLLLAKFSIWVLGESEIAYRLPSFSSGYFFYPFNIYAWKNNQSSMAVCSYICFIDGDILATPKIFIGG